MPAKRLIEFFVIFASQRINSAYFCIEINKYFIKFDISVQKYKEDINLEIEGIESNNDFDSLKPNLMKVFLEVLKKDEQIFDLTFKETKTLTLSLIALNQDEERDLINLVKADEFVGNLKIEMDAYPNLKKLQITKAPAPEDIDNWKPFSGNTNLNFI